MLPLASPQVVQTRKHSLEVRIAELRTPYKFHLILALARLTAVSGLEGQGRHSSHRGQPSCCKPSEQPHEKDPLQRQGGFPTSLPSSQLGCRNLATVVYMELNFKWSKVSQEHLQVVGPSRGGRVNSYFMYYE